MDVFQSFNQRSPCIAYLYLVRLSPGVFISSTKSVTTLLDEAIEKMMPDEQNTHCVSTGDGENEKGGTRGVQIK